MIWGGAGPAGQWVAHGLRSDQAQTPRLSKEPCGEWAGCREKPEVRLPTGTRPAGAGHGNELQVFAAENPRAGDG